MKPSLDRVVEGFESFMAGESGIDGVDLGGEDKYFSDDSDSSSDSDDISSEDDDMPTADDDGDIILDMDKLLRIFEEIACATTMDRKAVDSKSDKSMSHRKMPLHVQNINVHRTGEPAESVICGTGVHALPLTKGVMEELNDSKVQLEDVDSVSDSDDVSDEEVCDDEDKSDEPDEEFYREYEVLKKSIFDVFFCNLLCCRTQWKKNLRILH